MDSLLQTPDRGRRIYPAAEYPDGSPLPPHTYGYVQYDGQGNRPETRV